MFEIVKKAYQMGKTYGIKEGYSLYKDETALSGALGIIVALGTVLIGLYIIAIVVGSIDYSVQTGNILMTGQFNTTIDSMSTNAATTFSLANIVPIALIGIGVLALVIGGLMRTD